jgi:hypothetical protein
MNIPRLLFISFSIILLIYLIIPGPGSVFDFPALPESTKSDEPGDTYQVPNIVAYFSANFRDFVILFYSSNYQSRSTILIPPLRLNHPPEYGWETVRDRVTSTYLEELVYPLRDSLFINGYEPFLENGEPRFAGAVPIEINGMNYDTKTTLRYYPSPVWARMLVWVGIVTSILLIWKVGKKVI